MSLRWIALVILALALAAEGFAAESWKAGVAKVNITPAEYMWMAGYGARDHVATGKLSELWAKCLVLEDAEGKKVVLITLDLVGIERHHSQSICRKLQEKYKLDRSQIAINCSHTHSGPVVARNLRPMHFYGLTKEQQNQVLAYAAKLEESLVELVGKAIGDLAPAKVEWGSGTTDFAVNRRNNKEPDVPMLRAAGRLVGPNDQDVPVLAVKDERGKLRAIACGYACHATVLSGYDWSADYPGYAQTELESGHPDCVALFWAGCGADQNPLPRRTPELAETYGKMLASAVNEVLARPMSPVNGSLQTAYAEIPLALATLPTRDELVAQSNDTSKYIAMRAKMLLEDIDGGQALSPTYPYPIQRWQLGEGVQWFFLGGEVVVDFAIRIKSENTGTKTWVAGYSNDVMAYIPSRRVLTEGGYEGGGAMAVYGLPTIWSERVEEQIIEEVQNQSKSANKQVPTATAEPDAPKKSTRATGPAQSVGTNKLRR
jgi:hypothetical protein